MSDDIKRAAAAALVDEQVRQGQAAQMQAKLTEMERQHQERHSAEDIEAELLQQATDTYADLNKQRSEVEAAFVEVLDGVRDLKKQVERGALNPEEARDALVRLRREYVTLTNKGGALADQLGRAEAIKNDPAAHREALMAKYPGLRR